ncbi:MAG: hypothetical protein ACHQ49_16490 [Elusimicrobiota bacterium]
MKITIDPAVLLEEGKITREEHDKLMSLSRKETKLHASAIFTVLAIIAVVAGTVGLFPDFFASFVKAAAQLLEPLVDLLGPRSLQALLIIVIGAGAILADSGFLAGLCALQILTFLGNAGVLYTHAAYFVAIQEPAMTVLAFSGLAYAGFAVSETIPPKRQRVLIIFSRTCIFLVNAAFWVGSLWGCDLAGYRIAGWAFALGWAAALIAAGAWAAARDRRWVVNTIAVFGSIHFYTQWFERLGASPGSLLAAGAAALGILYGFREYNRARPAPKAAA